MVAWQNALGVFAYALVIQFEEYFDSSFYTLTIVQAERIKTLTLYHKDKGQTWRVLQPSS